MLLEERFKLTPEDSKRHLKFPFHWPAAGGELRAELTFSPWISGGLRSLITLSLTGPEGFRGAGHRHGNQHEVRLSLWDATPGYLPGELLSGDWLVTVHTHLILADTAVELRVWREEAKETLPFPELEPAQSPTPGLWMMGDLHCHTNHSDARWTAQELAGAAAARGLHFLALTDHNTLSGRSELAGAYGGLTLPGFELTTYYGHAVVIGSPDYPDWTTLTPEQGMYGLSSQLRQRPGQYLTIAHPFAAGDPICTGCAWTTFDLRPENTSHMEVWNGPWSGRHNERALAYWYTLLARGLRVIATAGTDAHYTYHPDCGFTCTPTTTTALALAAQLQRGETYLARSATLLPKVTVAGRDISLGGEAPAGHWQAELRCEAFPEGSEIVWVVDGVRHIAPLVATPVASWSGECHQWLNFEVRLPDSSLYALGNPVYAQRL